jgi:hypothetical protein
VCNKQYTNDAQFQVAHRLKLVSKAFFECVADLRAINVLLAADPFILI